MDQGILQTIPMSDSTNPYTPVDHDPFAPFIPVPKSPFGKGIAVGADEVSNIGDYLGKRDMGQRFGEAGEFKGLGGIDPRIANPLAFGAWAGKHYVVDPIADAAGLTGDVMSGKYGSQPSPDNPEFMGRVLNAAGLVTGGSMAAPVERDALGMGVRAYHGSPHDFDEFELSPRTSMTGEGAQKYGHGLYLAESEDVAKNYRDALSPQDENRWLFDGEELRKNMTGDEVIDRLLNELVDDPYVSVHEARQAIADWHDDYNSSLGDEGYYDAASHLKGVAKEVESRLERPSLGHVYETEIDAPVEHFLDWDKPLHEQSPFVQQALRAAGLAEKTGTGKSAYYKLSGPKEDAVQATEVLRKAGVPGIRYLDQFSRGSGKGTHNLTVFDDGLISIVKKYGIAGIMALPPAILEALKSGRIEPVDHDPFAGGQL